MRFLDHGINRLLLVLVPSSPPSSKCVRATPAKRYLFSRLYIFLILRSCTSVQCLLCTHICYMRSVSWHGSARIHEGECFRDVDGLCRTQRVKRHNGQVEIMSCTQHVFWPIHRPSELPARHFCRHARLSRNAISAFSCIISICAGRFCNGSLTNKILQKNSIGFFIQWQASPRH